MNKLKVGLFLSLSAISFLRLFFVSQVSAVSCPYVDGGFGDGDSTVNGTILINTNRSISASLANSGIFDCSSVELHITSGTTVTLESYETGDTNYDDDFGVTLQVGALTVESGGILAADAQGYPFTYGPGVGGNRTGQYSGAGGGYGGTGGNGNISLGGIIYGSLIAPIDLGSGGGIGQGTPAGGSGGGAIKVVATGSVIIDGLLSTNGGAATQYGGGGSGGSIWIVGNAVVGGSGTISSVGGGSTGGPGAGAGGRIVIETPSFSDTLTLVATGGVNTSNALYSGTNGTAIVLDTDDNSLNIRNSQKWYPDSYTYFRDTFPTITSILVTNNSTLQLASKNTDQVDESGYGWDITVDTLTIDSGSTLTSTGLGYEIAKGPGAGGVRTRYTGAGGGHGGKGGNAQGSSGSTVYGGPTYGSEISPITLGSGGALGQTSTIITGRGGGAIKITAYDQLTINGTLAADGEANTNDNGAGAGGSLWLLAHGVLSGSGSLSAKGGNSNGGGGSGGGGRVSIISHINEFLGSFSVAAGTHSNPLYVGEDGTFFLSGLPSKPGSSTQLDSEDSEIEVGGQVHEDSIVLEVLMSDPDSSDQLYAEFEVRVVGDAFTDTATHTSPETSYVDTPVVGSVTVSGLEDLTNYHWQSRVCNSSDYCSQWIAYGENAESETDFSVVLNANPSDPIIPGSSVFIDGQRSNDTTPTFLFSQSDPDSENQVKYQIQVADTADFSSVVIDFTGSLMLQGSASFTVGQNAGSGTYAVGSAGQTLAEGDYYWRVKTIDENDAESAWVDASGDPAFTIDTTSPTNVVTTNMKAYAAHPTTHTDDSSVVWFSRSDIYFSWITNGDTSGLKGYCLYLGTDPDGDPSTQKGLLGASPVSTTGSNCQFIIDDNSVDFSNTALRGNTWLSSSSEPYYFKIRPIDTANNAGQNDTASSTFSFYFDGTSPNNVKTISASSGSVSSIADMSFYWPISGPQAASDAGSGILGYQYAVNSTDTWRGIITDDTTGYEYIATDSAQPFSLNASVVGDDIIVGSNVLYFRTVDRAGNASAFTTAPLEYGGEAPAFDSSAVVTVTPSTNTENMYSFNWPDATPSDGRTITNYYYMINTAPPALYQTITSNSATYVPTTQTSISTTSLSNVRKGSNTIYVVAVDDNQNYSQSNYIYGNFTLDSSLPDAPQSLVVSDASVKTASLWRASLAWSSPDYRGTGDLTYTIQRSNDANSWTDIDSTSGLAFLDTLSTSSLYYWRVAATDSSDESIASPSYSNAVSLIPKGAYTEPAELTSGPAASSITTKRATITWTTARTSDSKVSIGTSSGNYEDEETSNSTQVSEHTINLINLEPGKTYYYKTKWTDEDGNTGESEEKSFQTNPAPLVKDVVVKNIGIDSALIEFTTVGASAANISYGKSTSFGGIETIATSSLETTYAIQLSDLDDGTKYYFKIDTEDSEADTYAGTILDFETLPRPEVSNVRVQQVANTAQSSIRVTWESNTPISSIITFYPESNPEYARDAVDIELLDGEHEMIVPGLLPETSYILIVKGRDRIGNEAVSDNLRFTTATDTRPPRITDLTVEGTNVPQVNTTAQESNSQLVVTWTTDEPATSQVEFGDGTGVSYSQTTQEDRTLTYNHLVIVSGLTPSKVYHLRAISRDSANNESRSIDTVTITPKATDNAFDLVITNLREVFGFLNGL